ncbi:hypothetical protein P376_3422 [Streptomyces sp. HCCB10043]|nr:hypothetical protein P376_3422 [Streptomyces sp. HCCB10043]
MEAGAEDDRVDLGLGAVGGDHRGAAYLAEPRGDDVHIGLGERRVVGAGEQDPLAADAVVGGQLGPQGRVLDGPRHVGLGYLLHQAQLVGVLGEGADLQLPYAPEQSTACGAGGGYRPVECALGLADGAVHARHDPGRGALEERELRGLRLYRGDDLDRGGAGADHRDALAGQVVVVVPAGGVEDLAGEGVEPGYVGHLGVGERTGGGDDDIRVERGAVGGLDHPVQVLLVPAHQLHLVVQPDMRAEPEGVGDALQVGPDVLLAGEGARPVRIGREGEGVEVGRYVAGAAGIAVVAPGAAHRAGPLQDDEIGDAFAAQPDGGPQAPESGTDHRHTYVLLLGHAAASRGTSRDFASNHWHGSESRTGPY